ncbi:hypothetical protein GUJ93_ZPchr0004g39343 [Zizania palustris]|uniref:Secreted protein n=1 Tax=Zizania palustris TaxID=103762 RepID=A0A8J5VFB5_ZIZPA|nr:hypothetical protein GUJ93_ZPchr0004g39343 [Zizania palustris]
MMFSLALAASTAATDGALPAAREEIDEGVVGRPEAVEEGVVGRANAAEGVLGRPPEDDDGVVDRAEVEEGVEGRPPDEVLAGGFGAAPAPSAGERRDRNGEMLERVVLDDDIAAGLGATPGSGRLGLELERASTRCRELVEGRGGARGLCFSERSSSSSEAPGSP